MQYVFVEVTGISQNFQNCCCCCSTTLILSRQWLQVSFINKLLSKQQLEYFKNQLFLYLLLHCLAISNFSLFLTTNHNPSQNDILGYFLWFIFEQVQLNQNKFVIKQHMQGVVISNVPKNLRLLFVYLWPGHIFRSNLIVSQNAFLICTLPRPGCNTGHQMSILYWEKLIQGVFNVIFMVGGEKGIENLNRWLHFTVNLTNCGCSQPGSCLPSSS